MAAFLKKCTAGLCACVLACTLAAPAHAAGSAAAATGCIRNIATAVDRADLAGFKKLVDTDAVIGDAADQLSALSQDQETARWVPPALALLTSQGMPKNLKDMLVAELRNFIHNGVGSGAFAGHARPSYKGQGTLAPLFAQASPGRKEIRSIGKAEPSGDGWDVPFTVHDDNGHDYAVRGHVVCGEGQCRLNSVGNSKELLLDLCMEAQE